MSYVIRFCNRSGETRHVWWFHKHAKAERGQYSVISTEQAWSIKDLLYGFQGNFFLRDTAGSPERAI